jgi:hypothetical protein
VWASHDPPRRTDCFSRRSPGFLLINFMSESAVR